MALERNTPALRVTDQSTTEDSASSEHDVTRQHDRVEEDSPTEAKNAKQSQDSIQVYFGGVRLFGDAQPPTNPIDVKLYIGENLVLEGELPVPTPSRYRRVYRATYQTVKIERTNPLSIKVTSERVNSQAILLLKSSEGDWIHIDYDAYSADHPYKAQQGLQVTVHKAPQIFR